MVRASRLVALVIAIVLVGGLARSVTAQGTSTGAEDIPANLTPPASSVLLFELGASGVQIYTCEADPNDATAFVWTFKAPEADLLNGRGEVVGHHFAGPTWQGQDGSAVVGTVLERADAPTPPSRGSSWKPKTTRGSGAFRPLPASSGSTPAAASLRAKAATRLTPVRRLAEPYEATYAFYYPASIATPGAATAATGSVTIKVFSCPAKLSQTTGQPPVDQDTLMAECTTFVSPETIPTLSLLPDGEPIAGAANESGEYHWDGLAFGDYAIGGSGEQPANMVSVRVTNADGAPLQNPVLHLGCVSPGGESIATSTSSTDAAHRLSRATDCESRPWSERKTCRRGAAASGLNKPPPQESGLLIG